MLRCEHGHPIGATEQEREALVELTARAIYRQRIGHEPEGENWCAYQQEAEAVVTTLFVEAAQ